MLLILCLIGADQLTFTKSTRRNAMLLVNGPYKGWMLFLCNIFWNFAEFVGFLPQIT